LFSQDSAPESLTMNAGNQLETKEVPVALDPEIAPVAKQPSETSSTANIKHDDYPTEEDMRTLRRVSGPIPWTAYTIAFVELCERFSYYGTTAVFVNFIQQDLPPGSNTGAGFEGQSGALGMGQRASTGLTTL
jgi:POT family proton-dependent oligopeptide transporter